MHIIEILLALVMLAFGIVGAVLSAPDRPRQPAFWASCGVILGAIVLLIITIPIGG